MRGSATRIAVIVAFAAGALAGCARAQEAAAPATTPAARRDSLARTAGDYGTLSQNDIVVRLRNEDLDIRLVPLDVRVTTLLARDAADSLQRLVARERTAIDSAARASGVAEPGLARVNPLLIQAILLNEEELRQIVEFVRNGLLDPRAKPENLRKLIPESVPSGMALPRFQ